MIPVIQPRVDIRKTLMEKELGSKLTYYETLQLLVEQQEELSVQKSHLHEAEAAVAAVRETRARRWPNSGAHSPTNSPRPCRRRTGSPRT
jgi:hemolysin D